MITAELTILLVAALATGGLMVNWIGLARAMACLSASAYVEFHQNTNRTFDPYMPIVVIGALLRGVALVVIFGIHTASGQLSVGGVTCFAAVLAIGLPTDVQINKQIAAWSIGNPPCNWAEVRARWIRFHILRTLFSVPAFVLYVAASILRTS
jgi:hypothetical protein